MYRRSVLIIWVLAVLLSITTAQAQNDEVLQVLAIDYMGEALESTGIFDMGIEIELTVVNQREIRDFTLGGALGEFDIVLVDNQTLDPFLPELGEGFFIPLCERVPDLCPLPDPDICALYPWLPVCGNPCPPTALSCPPILWDIPIILDPWEPMEWTLDRLIEVVETETVMVDLRNEVGFFPRPAIFDVARPNLTMELEEAFLVFTPACNYVMHYEEFTEMGFLPITVEGYQETPFNVGAYITAEGNVELATEFASMLIADPNVQLQLFEATGLLPGNLEALNEVLPR